MRTTMGALLGAVLVLAACGSDDGDDATSDDGAGAGPAVVAGEAFPEERCETNREAGTITYLTGFDYAAASSIVNVLVADANGHYEAMCLDVEIRPGFSSSNYGLIAAGNAQFASGGSFSESVAFAAANDGDVIAMSVEGRTAIDTLMIKAGEAASLEDLAGTTIGVKGKLPTSIDVMLREAGLVEGEDFQTVLLDGFDPLAHMAIDSIVGLPGWKSNEVGALDRAGVPIDLFDPLDAGVPGSFGVIVSNPAFIADHPTAAEDFMRASMRGLADAIADPAAAATVAVGEIDAGGNPNFLSPEGETFRWATEAELISELTPDGVGLGVPDLGELQVELDAYAAAGLFGEGDAPQATDHVATGVVEGLYEGDVLVWPS